MDDSIVLAPGPSVFELLTRVRDKASPWLLARTVALAEEVFALICLAPEEAVSWIREHLEEIEARLAS